MCSMSERTFAKIVTILFYIGLASSFGSFIASKISNNEMWVRLTFYSIFLLTLAPFIALVISFFFADRKLKILKILVIVEIIFALYISFHP